MAWHQRHRLQLLRARLALLTGDAGTAGALAAAVADDAAQRGAARYEYLARATAGLADRSIPDAELDVVVAGLAQCAVLDGWPLIAALATSRGSARWHAEAERLAAAVVASAAPVGADELVRGFVDMLVTAAVRSGRGSSGRGRRSSRTG
jgi:hypothetical protein